ncbi:MAG: F0F1 ATP synthase subunit B [Candidatus Omnitrophica bacterium]|nr:F0F1 ATP synthase subunit B [Candidatus Omnitrophota bacterium]
MFSYLLLAAAGAETGGTFDQIARTFGVNWPHFIAQVISFCIVALLLQRFAYKPILQVLEERKQRIAEGLANAEKIKEELAKTEAARREVLQQTQLQANRLIAEAQAAAARVHEIETQKAIANAEQILAKAHEAAALDHARMMTELRREFGRLVVETTTHVTGKILTTEDQQRLAEEAQRQLAA